LYSMLVIEKCGVRFQVCCFACSLGGMSMASFIASISMYNGGKQKSLRFL
jgi:hypothetical protein